jgi:hypothetical protein
MQGITKEQIQAMVERGAGYAEIKQAAGKDAFVCVLAGTGSAFGIADGIPSIIEGKNYHSDTWGSLFYFKHSGLKIGEVIEIYGRKYQVIVNQYTPGDAWVPCYTAFVAFPINDFDFDLIHYRNPLASITAEIAKTTLAMEQSNNAVEKQKLCQKITLLEKAVSDYLNLLMMAIDRHISQLETGK